MHLNVQGGLLYKNNYLEIILQQSNFAIVCLNDHWLYNDGIFIFDSRPYSKLHLAHHYRREAGNDGVSCILLDSSLGYNVREDLCTYNQGFEVLKLSV